MVQCKECSLAATTANQPCVLPDKQFGTFLPNGREHGITAKQKSQLIASQNQFADQAHLIWVRNCEPSIVNTHAKDDKLWSPLMETLTNEPRVQITSRKLFLQVKSSTNPANLNRFIFMAMEADHKDAVEFVDSQLVNLYHEASKKWKKRCKQMHGQTVRA